jgi:GntR family transcriptional regulator, transcriptional repressor for pyruvate dehydrogenase complex
MAKSCPVRWSYGGGGIYTSKLKVAGPGLLVHTLDQLSTPRRNSPALATSSRHAPPAQPPTPFRPIRIRKAADEVVAVVADAIRGGLYEPGDRLPGLRELADQLGVSRTVVGEAVEQLRRAEVVNVRRGKGGGIVVRSLTNLPAVIARIRGDTRSSLRAILEARRSVEMAAAPLAAERGTKEDLARLERLVSGLATLIDEPEEFLQLDISFHYALVETAGNAILNEFHARSLNELMTAREPFPSGRIAQARAIDIQEQTLRAVQSRNRKRAINAHDEHLAELEQVFLGERLPYP